MTKRLPFLTVTLLSLPALGQPPVENDALKSLIGKWWCDDTTAIAIRGQPPVKVKSEYEIKPAVNKVWLHVTFTQKKQKDYPGFRGEAYVGWVSSHKKYVFAGFDDLGGHIYLWAPASAAGLAFTGDAQVGDQTVPLKYTWTKASDRERSFVIEVQEGGEWMRVSDATCRKR